MSKMAKIILTISLIGNLAIVYVAMKALEYRAHINEFLDKYTYVVNEFSRRDAYGSLNESFKSDSTVADRIVFFGTQTIERWDLADYFPNYGVINRGVTGQFLSGMVLRAFPDIIDLKPGFAVIEVSSYNFRPQNSVDELIDYTRSLFELCSHNGIKPIACTIIPPCPDSVDLGDYKILDSLALFNRWLTDYSTKNNQILADWNNILADSTGHLKLEYSSAAIDLNRRGYELISNEILTRLEEADNAY